MLELLSCSLWASLPWECDARKSSAPWISKSYFGFEAHAGRHTTASLRFDVRETDMGANKCAEN